MDMLYKVDQAKSFFFDRPTVDQLHEDARRGLARFGSFVRRTARTSLRRARRLRYSEMTTQDRQKFRIREEYARRLGWPEPMRPLVPSQPGEPPRMRVGHIKKFLFFAYDPEARSVVIGPALIDRPTGAPWVLEEGGTSRMYIGPNRFKMINIAPRPYMRPAFEANIDKLPRLMAGDKR